MRASANSSIFRSTVGRTGSIKSQTNGMRFCDVPCMMPTNGSNPAATISARRLNTVAHVPTAISQMGVVKNVKSSRVSNPPPRSGRGIISPRHRRAGGWDLSVDAAQAYPLGAHPVLPNWPLVRSSRVKLVLAAAASRVSAPKATGFALGCSLQKWRSGDG